MEIGEGNVEGDSRFSSVGGRFRSFVGAWNSKSESPIQKATPIDLCLMNYFDGIETVANFVLLS